MAYAAMFRVVQPWGKDVGREATIVSEHKTVEDAFAEIERLAEQMVRTGARSDSVRLNVLDDDGDVIPRPGTY